MKTFKKKNLSPDDTRRYLEPGPIVLVSSAWKGETNIMTMGWHMMMGFSPALFACYIWDANHSFEMIRRSQQCVINLPTTDLLKKARGKGLSRCVGCYECEDVCPVEINPANIIKDVRWQYLKESCRKWIPFMARR